MSEIEIGRTEESGLHIDYFTIKCIYIGVLFFGVLLISLIPMVIVYVILYRINKKYAHEIYMDNGEVISLKHKNVMRVTVKWTDRISAFAAGILIAAGLLHIYPEAEELFQEGLSMLNRDPHMFPFTSLFTLIGLVIFVVLDIIIEYCIHPRSSMLLTTTSSTSSTAVSTQSTTGPQVHLNLPLFQIIMLIFCMSFHSVLEGITLGLLTNLHKLMTIFVAILIHTLIIAFSIGMRITEVITASMTDTESGKSLSLKSVFRLSRRTIFFNLVSLIIFSASLPLGIIIGMNLSNKNKTANMKLTLGVIQGLCCGTFFFVVFSEMLPQTLYNHGLVVKEKFLRVFNFAFGIVTIIVLTIIFAH